jgi:hypothetical protein
VIEKIAAAFFRAVAPHEGDAVRLRGAADLLGAAGEATSRGWKAPI